MLVFVLQVEREKAHTEELISKTTVERTSLDRSLGRLEDENAEMRQQLYSLQTQLSQLEQEHAQR